MNATITLALKYSPKYYAIYANNYISKLTTIRNHINSQFNKFFLQYFTTNNNDDVNSHSLVTSPRDTIINNKYILDPDDYERGINTLKQTLRIQLISLPYFSEDIAHSYLNLAMAEHQNILLLDQAKEHYMAAYNIFCKIKGSESLEALNVLTNFAVVLRDLNNIQESITVLEKVLNAKKAANVNPKLLLDTLNNLGVIMHETKNYEKALYYYKEALQLIGDSNNLVCEFIALLYFNIGCAYRESGSISEAVEHMKISKDICNKLDNKMELTTRINLELKKMI